MKEAKVSRIRDATEKILMDSTVLVSQLGTNVQAFGPIV